jgi:hypothetical protein
VQQVLRRCLHKDRKLRLHDIGDARLELDDTGPAFAPVSSAPPESRRRERLLWAGALIGLSSIVGAAVWWLRTPAPPDETRLEISTPPSTDLLSFALSPDGRYITFVATSNGQSMLWLRAIASTTAAPLEGTEGASAPFWSPDSQSIGFVAGNKLKRLDLAGRVVRPISEASPGSGTWSPSGVILYRQQGKAGLFRITDGANAAAQVVDAANGITGYFVPHFLPDGSRFICFGAGFTGGSRDLSWRARYTRPEAARVHRLGGALRPT